MGAGKGRARRTQAGAPPRNRVLAPRVRGTLKNVAYDNKQWMDFVDGHDLSEVRLYDYYSGGTTVEYSSASHAEVVTQIFADTVSVGALILPGSYQTNDFVFEMESGTPGESSMRLILKGAANKNKVATNIIYYFADSHTLSDADLSYFLQQVAEAID